MRITAFTIAFFVLLPSVSNMRAEELLALENKIPLGKVAGRIDHLAVDLNRKRLFVAELGNNGVSVVDLAERKVIRRISGLKEPQGVGYVPSTDMLYVANAGDGSVRLFQGSDLAPIGQIELGADADNIRVYNGAGRVYVGFGSGGIAVIDTVTRQKIGETLLKAHASPPQRDTHVALDSRSRQVICGCAGRHQMSPPQCGFFVRSHKHALPPSLCPS